VSIIHVVVVALNPSRCRTPLAEVPRAGLVVYAWGRL